MNAAVRIGDDTATYQELFEQLDDGELLIAGGFREKYGDIVPVTWIVSSEEDYHGVLSSNEFFLACWYRLPED